ncbi:MAG: GntR family transcriptional regulator [Eubacteriaceae bacterium]|jgi:DNA-binding GntR family transcriptional regulator|nr:GntR family transcriptional regulator [Eubacteriaceae bacterium]
MTKEKFEEYVRRHPMATLSSIIYEILYDEIVSGELSPGTKMNTAQLAEEINVSRTPIIDAYEKLKEIRFIETSPTKGGYYVSPLYISDFRDMMIVRKALEKTAAYTVASIHNMEHIEELYEIAEKLQAILFDDKYYMQRDLENRFHSLIVESSKNSYLIDAYQSISKRLYRHYYYMDHMSADTANLFVTKEAAYEHIAICKALESGLPESAEKAMERHMDAAMIIYLIHAHKWYS